MDQYDFLTMSNTTPKENSIPFTGSTFLYSFEINILVTEKQVKVVDLKL